MISPFSGRWEQGGGEAELAYQNQRIECRCDIQVCDPLLRAERAVHICVV